jgi:hypothetical protein
MTVGTPSISGGAILQQNDKTTDSLRAGAVGVSAVSESTAPSSRMMRKTADTGYEMTNARGTDGS